MDRYTAFFCKMDLHELEIEAATPTAWDMHPLAVSGEADGARRRLKKEEADGQARALSVRV